MEILFISWHCSKSVQIRSFFWSEYRKIRSRKNSVFGHLSRSVIYHRFCKIKRIWCWKCETLAGDSFMYSKDHQIFRNLKIIFFARRVEIALFEWRSLQSKCLPVVFVLSSISIFKSNRGSNTFLTVSAALPLSDLIVGAENVTPVSGMFL